jgi:hypothetical protein
MYVFWEQTVVTPWGWLINEPKHVGAFYQTVLEYFSVLITSAFSWWKILSISYFSLPITYTTEYQQSYCMSWMHECNGVNSGREQIHWQSLANCTYRGTCSIQIRSITAWAKLLGIGHKIYCPFYYIMCKQNVTYCLTSVEGGHRGLWAHLGA